MRKEFLRQVAELFFEKEGTNLKEYCFVFPNRRSSLFFRKYLGLSSDKPLFSPYLITVNSLFLELSNLRLGDKIAMLYSLYKVYIKHVPSAKSESFDGFLFWGDVILNDFDDIDKYLADAQKLFSNIKDLKELDSGYDFLSDEQRKAIEEFWSTILKFETGEKEQSFLTLWNRLFNIYTDFREELRVSGEVYEGMIYRTVIDEIQSGHIIESLSKYKKIVFVGLNALNKCERLLLSYLKKEGKADFYWDYFGEVIKDPDNKSSLFMKENVLAYPSQYSLCEDGGGVEETPHIEAIGVPSMVGQTRLVTKILSELIPPLPNGGFDSEIAFSTAVVLPDEKLLQPLLNAIPAHIGKINVTMGYTLSNTNVASFMSIVAALQSKIRLNGQKISYYHSCVIDILEHPYIMEIVPDIAKRLRKEIVAKNMIFIPQDILKSDSILDIIFGKTPKLILDKSAISRHIAQYQIDILLELQKYLPDMEREFIYHYYTCINRIKDLNLPIAADTYFRLVQQAAATISIPFKGEPLSGLQVMGPLETRALDFDNVIILSSNEGIFPSRNVSSSFIPYNLRRGFELPNYEFQDSISAYHFYRSIYRASNVYLLYDARSEGMNTGEATRYIKQLKYHHKIPIKESIVSYSINISDTHSVTIPKNEVMLAKLDAKSFSASSINTYLKCPLWFYFQEIEEIREEDSVVEEIESDVFGQLFHKTMEGIYSEYKGRSVAKSSLEEMMRDEKLIPSYILKSFQSELGIDTISGQNKIIEALLLRYVQRTVQYDLSIGNLRILDLELDIPSVPLDIYGGDKRVFLKGFIDRLDIADGKQRIIDYKTGGIKMEFKEVEDMFSLANKNRPYTAFQLLFYLLILKKSRNIPDVSLIEMRIYSIKDIFKGVEHSLEVTEELLMQFESLLSSTIEQILDISIPFVGCSDEDVCSYCPYKILCNK